MVLDFDKIIFSINMFRLDYFSTECVYAPFAARGFARDFVKDLEVGSKRPRFSDPSFSETTMHNCMPLFILIGYHLLSMMITFSYPEEYAYISCTQAARPSAIIDLIHSAEQFRFQTQTEQRLLQPRTCDSCGFISSQPICKACTLLAGLNQGRPAGRRAAAMHSIPRIGDDAGAAALSVDAQGCNDEALNQPHTLRGSSPADGPLASGDCGSGACSCSPAVIGSRSEGTQDSSLGHGQTEEMGNLLQGMSLRDGGRRDMKLTAFDASSKSDLGVPAVVSKSVKMAVDIGYDD